MKRFVIIALLSTSLLASGTAYGQMSNQPYQSPRVAAGSGPGASGMSLGYRQAILQQHLTGRTPGAMARGPGGFLLNVTRESGTSNAIVTVPGESFVPGFGRLSRLSLGTLGWARYSEGGSRSYGVAGSDTVPLEWLAMIEHSAPSAGWLGFSTGGTAGSPINHWISLIL